MSSDGVLPSMAPTCPLCSTNDRVERDRCGGRQVFLCGGCFTIFLARPDEWEQNRERREMRAKWCANGARTFHEANVERGAPPVWARGSLAARIDQELAEEVPA